MSSCVEAVTSLVAQLRQTTKLLPDGLRREVLAKGDAVVPDLIALLRDEAAARDDSPSEGWAPVHAVELLADLEATEAIDPMLDLLDDADFDEVLTAAVMRRLPDLGPAVLEPALLRKEKVEKATAWHALVSVLARLSVKDDRVFDVLCEVFEDDNLLGAAHFAAFGSPRALPRLYDAIRDFVPDFDAPSWRVELNEMLAAVETLGGVLPAEALERVDVVEDLWRQRSAEARPTKIGRNDPCPCDSGKKYKKCCIDKASAGAS